MGQTIPAGSPARFFETVNSYQKTAALKAALELDLFTFIGEGVQKARDLADRCHATVKGIRILCDYLVVNGFLTKAGNQYGLAPDSAAFLDRSSPTYMGSAARFLASNQMLDSFRDPAAVVRKGGTVQGELGHMAPEHPVWVEFAEAMAPVMALPARLITELLAEVCPKPTRILDIAAGHGAYGITVARRFPQATVTAVDWPNVLELARRNAAEAGILERYRCLEGSAFDVDFGEGYDAVLLSNFLHHFSPQTCKTLLRKIHASLAPGGTVLTVEFVPNEDRVSPPIPAMFSFIMLGVTKEGDAYTFSEFQSMFKEAGFSSTRLHSLSPTYFTALVSSR